MMTLNEMFEQIHNKHKDLKRVLQKKVLPPLRRKRGAAKIGRLLIRNTYEYIYRGSLEIVTLVFKYLHFSTSFPCIFKGTVPHLNFDF